MITIYIDGVTSLLDDGVASSLYYKRKGKKVFLPPNFQQSPIAEQIRESGKCMDIQHNFAKFFPENIETEQQFDCYLKTITYWGIAEFPFDECLKIPNLRRFLAALKHGEESDFLYLESHFVCLQEILNGANFIRPKTDDIMIKLGYQLR